MEELQPQTESVRRILERRNFPLDEDYVRAVLQLERLAAMRPLGLASAIALANLMSRYPREADSIVQELGVQPFEPFEDERLRALSEERLRIAELRQRLAHVPRGGAQDLLDL